MNIKERELENGDRIKRIVIKHFSLDNKSNNLFQERINYPIIDEVYKKHLGEDLRCRIEITYDKFELLDKGWAKFKKFKSFINEYNITYEDFKKNKIIYKKNELKIFKLLRDFYNKKIGRLNNEIGNSTSFEIFFHSINASRLPGIDKLELVLSLNFADWFLCSTGESWESCLNLSSECDGIFWSGLPGLIGDKNRALLYITDGRKKNYNGIEVDRIISRTWLLLDKENNINSVRYYPNKIFNTKGINKIVNYKIESLKEDFVSKYKIDILRFLNGCSSYIYQDGTKFLKDGKICKSDSSGSYFFDKNNLICHRSVFDICSSLNEIIKASSDLESYISDPEYCCADCGDYIEEDDSFSNPYEDIVCLSCYNENYCRCENCDELMSEDSSEVCSIDLKVYCERCFNENYFHCDECGEIKNNDDMKTFENECLCEDCYTDKKEIKKNRGVTIG